VHNRVISLNAAINSHDGLTLLNLAIFFPLLGTLVFAINGLRFAICVLESEFVGHASVTGSVEDFVDFVPSQCHCFPGFLSVVRLENRRTVVTLKNHLNSCHEILSACRSRPDRFDLR